MRLPLAFLVVAFVSGVFGFSPAAEYAAVIARCVFFAAVTLFVVSLVASGPEDRP